MSKRNKGFKDTDVVGQGIYARFLDPFLNEPSRNRNMAWEMHYLNLLVELSMDRFKWHFPDDIRDDIDERFLEMTMLYRGSALFYWSPRYTRYFVSQYANSGTVNYYNNPTRFRSIAPSLRSEEFGPKEAVPIFGNKLRIPEYNTLRLYATRLGEIEMTIEQAWATQRHPYIISAPEEQRLTYNNAMRQIHEGLPMIFGDDRFAGGLTEERISVFNTGIHPDTLPKLMIAKAKTWNEIMTTLGINNANQEKRERLVADEVQANNEQVLSFRQVALDERKRAVYNINRLFKIDIDVTWNQDIDSVAKLAIESTPGPVIDNSGIQTGRNI